MDGMESAGLGLGGVGGEWSSSVAAPAFRSLSSTETGGDDALQAAEPNKELHIFYYVGSCITLASSLFVIFSYIKFKACRQHPSGLIFWRSMSDVIFSLQFIILFSFSGTTAEDHHCNVFSFLFQFSVLASQSWYFMNAVDLLRSMRNPFSDPANNMPMYHVFVWSMSFATSIAITAGKRDDYRRDMQLCWTSVSGSVFNYVNWLTFFIPTLFYYFFSIGTVIYAAIRLKKGLDQTFATRQIVLRNGIRYVAGFCAYWTFAGIIYGIIILEGDSSANHTPPEEPEEHKSNLPLYATFAVTIAFRGVVDVCIWVFNQRVHKIYQLWWRGLPHDDPAAVGMKDVDINRALRSEVLIFSTTGMALAIERANAIPSCAELPSPEQYPVSLDPREPRNMHSVVEITVSRADYSAGESQAVPRPAQGQTVEEDASVAAEEARARATAVTSNNSDVERVPFLDFAPQVFRFLRLKFGINEAGYKASIQGKTEAMIEKFTEGRGGAFFYFSEDGQYIVKTLTLSESRFLTRFLPRYVNYVSKQQNTLLSRFCGFHAITLYNLTIHFMVMQSVFLTTRKVHERYDLKGSYIDRHAPAPAAAAKPGSKNAKKNPKGGKRGAFRNVVLKDNDLNRTVRLTESDRVRFLHQVRKDALFLRDCNIMDYSLLLGVHHTSHQTTGLPMHLQQPQQSQGQVGGTGGAKSRMSSSTAGAGGHPVGSLSAHHPHGLLQQHGGGAGGANSARTSLASESFGGRGPTASRGSGIAIAPSASAANMIAGQFQSCDGGVQASIIEGPGIYFFGLIDILQEYNTNKKLEHFAKVYLRCKDGDGISAIPPKPYADRFVRFMSDITRSDEEEAICVRAAAVPAGSISMGDVRHNAQASAIGRSLYREEIHESNDDEQEEEEEHKGSSTRGSGGAATATVGSVDVRLDVHPSTRLFSGPDSSSFGMIAEEEREQLPVSASSSRIGGSSAPVQPVSSAALVASGSVASPSGASPSAAASPAAATSPASPAAGGLAVMPLSTPSSISRPASVPLQPMSVTESPHGSGSALATATEWSSI